MSSNPLLWKFVVIGAVVAGAIGFSVPPSERINLGLDLRGGAHILMQVDTDSALEYQRDLIIDIIGQRLGDAGFSSDSIGPGGPVSIAIRGTDPAKRSEIREVIDNVIGSWQVGGSGGNWLLSMPAAVQNATKKTAVDTTLTTLNNRINGLGVSEALIQPQGIDRERILIQLPGVQDPETAKKAISEPAQLAWKEVTYPPGVTDYTNWIPPDDPAILEAQFGGALPPDTVVYAQKISNLDVDATFYWPLKRVSTVAGADLRDAWRGSDEWGNPSVSFSLTQDAGRRFERVTRENLGKKMAILLNEDVLSAPVIRGAIRDQGVIEGGFTMEEADDLSLKLRSGAFPVKVKIIEERTVGPSLGRDSIRKGLISGLAGFAGILVFMVVYYRLSGVNAVVALALNVVLVFGALGALPFLFAAANVKATLTLPGIAGLILTVGMAVDANVLIFERIREELRLGKTVRSAVDQGFGKAFLTILDCNVTSIVAAIFLSLYGTGPVRGFAVTLIIGLAASMFTAVFVSRQLFELLLSRRQRAETLSI